MRINAKSDIKIHTIIVYTSILLSIIIYKHETYELHSRL